MNYKDWHSIFIFTLITIGVFFLLSANITGKTLFYWLGGLIIVIGVMSINTKKSLKFPKRLSWHTYLMLTFGIMALIFILLPVSFLNYFGWLLLFVSGVGFASAPKKRPKSTFEIFRETGGQDEDSTIKVNTGLSPQEEKLINAVGQTSKDMIDTVSKSDNSGGGKD